MFIYESRGVGDLNCGLWTNGRKPNGYYVGKKWAEVTAVMWKEDVRRGILFVWELYTDGRYPHWWLDEIFARN
jgi:hypothetical protein